MDDSDLERVFSQAGKVESSHCFFDKELLRPAGRGIVLFSKKEEALRAIKELDNIEIKGRKIKVQLNTKATRLLDLKKCTADEEDPSILYHHSSLSGQRNHDLSRSSGSHQSPSSRRHSSHRKHHRAAVNDYDYYDYDYDKKKRSRDRMRERDRISRTRKYDYDASFEHDYDHEQSKSRISVKDIDKKGEKKQLSSRIVDLRDNKIIQEQKPIRIEYKDHGPIIESEKNIQRIYVHAPIPQRQPPPLLPSMMPINIPVNSTIIHDPLPKMISYDQNIHGIGITSDNVTDIGNDIPHSLWLKVIDKRAHDVYNRLYTITKDHQIIKEKTLLRFQPNEVPYAANFIDALSSGKK